MQYLLAATGADGVLLFACTDETAEDAATGTIPAIKPYMAKVQAIAAEMEHAGICLRNA